MAPEHRCSPYRASDYSYPQLVEPLIVAKIGKVYGPYTGRCFASRSETDIEHMVARSEAHDSGLCAAAAETRRRFAQDLLNLTLAGPRVNRYQKRAHDAAQWLPPLQQRFSGSHDRGNGSRGINPADAVVVTISEVEVAGGVHGHTFGIV